MGKYSASSSNSKIIGAKQLSGTNGKITLQAVAVKGGLMAEVLFYRCADNL